MGTGEGAVLRIAEQQFGVVHRSTVLEGMTARQLERRVERGTWVRVAPSVYRVAGAPQTWRQSLMAASLVLKRGFAFSHRTAAALHGFRCIKEGALSVTVTRKTRLGAPFDVHRTKSLSHKDVEFSDGDEFRITSVLRTLIDLAATETAELMQSLVDEALQRKWLRVEEFERAVERAKRQPGVGVLRALVRRYRGAGGPTESELEARALEVLEGTPLPAPKIQRVVATRHRNLRVDLLFKDQRLIVEVDGYAFHSSPEAFEADRARTNLLKASGYTVLQWTWHALVNTPEVLLEQLYAALALGSRN